MKHHFWAHLTGAALAIGNGILLMGWLSRVPIWEPVTLHHTAATIPVLICCVLCGIGLLNIGRTAVAWRTTSFVAMGVMVAISGLMLIETAFGLELPIDLPDVHRWYRDANPYPGRMSPNSAMVFLLAAAALHRRFTGGPNDTLYHALPAAVIVMGALGLIAYTSIFDLAYEWYAVPHMAATTAVTAILFGIALLADHDGEEREAARSVTVAPLDVEKGRGYAFVGVAVTILAGVVFVSYGSIRALAALRDWVEHTARVRIEFETLDAGIAEANADWRIYAVTRDPQLLREANAAGSTALARIDTLSHLVADNPVQVDRLRSMRQLAERSLAMLQQGGRMGRANDEPVSLMANEQLFQQLTAQFRAEEDRLLIQRREKSDSGVRTTIWVMVGGNALAFSLMFYAGWQLRRHNALRDRLLGALEESNAFLDSLIEHIPSLITVKDARDLRIVRTNSAAAKTLGLTSAESIGKTHQDLFPANVSAVYTATDRAALSGSQALRVSEQSIMTHSGGMRIMHTTKIPIVGEDGTPKYLLSISEDITARKLAEQEIAGLNERITLRASELETVNKELESFTYSVSHDLRAPLRAINGYALMLDEDYRDKLGDDARRYLLQIRTYSRQMGDLIDDLLRLSRFGRQALQIVAVDMNSLVREVLAEETRDDPDMQRFDVHVGELPSVCADPQLIRLVWNNLVSNALKYSGKTPRPRIEIGGERRDSDIVYYVKDNGAGFDMAYYDKLFSVFQRLHRNDEFPGTGVGLAIVHRIVVRHGGRVWAEGAVDRGATFFFLLPHTAREPAPIPQ